VAGVEETIEEIFLSSSREFTSEEITLIESIIEDLENGKLRCANKTGSTWEVNTFVKKAILLYMKLKSSTLLSLKSENFSLNYYDKIPLKFQSFTEEKFKEGGFRVVPGSIVRKGAFIGKRVILMPSFVNIGAFIDEGTMIDTWATVGSCAQIGKNCHISGGAGIGGVLEPVSERPVIIENNVFIGARSEVAEGVIVEENSVLSMGVYLGASTPIVNRETGEIFKGRIPKGSVVVPGSVPSKNGVNLYAAIIVKTVDERTRQKTSLNELLRS
jgi:2,3,4,5-tetrahydropyridine-2-carboxylate N-succinyltransferase